MQLQLKTILNRVHPIKGFIYADIRLVDAGGTPQIEATLVEHGSMKPPCIKCDKPGACYDHQPNVGTTLSRSGASR